MQPIAIKNYINVEKAVKAEIERLTPTSTAKAREVSNALDRLYLVIVQAHPEMELKQRRYTVGKRINPQQTLELDLKTIQAMLNIKISEWEYDATDLSGRDGGYQTKLSLREALNIATCNVFNTLGGNWGALWGKSQALINVEEELNIDLPPTS